MLQLAPQKKRVDSALRERQEASERETGIPAKGPVFVQVESLKPKDIFVSYLLKQCYVYKIV